MTAQRILPVRVMALGSLLAAAASTVWSSTDPLEITREASARRLVPSEAIRLQDYRVRIGPATLIIEDVVVVPATPLPGGSLEAVLVGKAELQVDPPTEIEAAQLELFAGERTLSEPIEHAVLVTCSERVTSALRRVGRSGDVDADTLRRAEETFAAWSQGVERRMVGVDDALTRAAIGDDGADEYFAGKFHGRNLGDVLVLIDPDASEQVSVGQFVPLELTERTKRKARKWIHRARRHGRLLGLELESLGTWDTWVSTQLTDSAGQPYRGRPGFEPTHHEIEVEIDPEALSLAGTDRMRLLAVHGGRRTVDLVSHSDLRVHSVRGPDGGELPFVQDHGHVRAYLPTAPTRGSEVTLQVGYSGAFLEKISRGVLRLVDTLNWHPSVDDTRATYDVTLVWPPSVDVIAAGELVGEGVRADGRRWERRTMEHRSVGYSFEVGKFEVWEQPVDDVAIRFAFHRETKGARWDDKVDLVNTVANCLQFFDERLGEYPLQHLTVVTSERHFAQSLPGFVTLPLGGRNSLDITPSARVVIAHEIAHQWWGNLVGWASYRDEWLSEGMASYLSMAWARNRLGDVQRRAALQEGHYWHSRLEYPSATGRPNEALGPIALGRRLDSSLSFDAYESIVYGKGLLVLNTLAFALGDDEFLEVLSEIVSAAPWKRITTDAFLGAVEGSTGINLGWYRARFVEGTGMPEVLYTAEYEPTDDGRWQVRGQAEQLPSLRAEYALVKRPDGTLDCRRELVPRVDVSGSRLIVPFQIECVDAAAAGKKRKKWTRRVFRPEVRGVMLIRSRIHEFEVTVDQKPERFWLDRHGETFGKFHAEDASPKISLWFRARSALAEGATTEAEALFRRAREAAVDPDAAPAGREGNVARRVGSLWDAQLSLELAHLALDRDDLAAAEGALASAADHGRIDGRRFLSEPFDVAHARLEVRRGEPDRALVRLRQRRAGTHRLRSTRGWLLLGIAARAGDDMDLLRKAMKEAERRGADVSLLRKPAKSAQ